MRLLKEFLQGALAAFLSMLVLGFTLPPIVYVVKTWARYWLG